MAGEENKFRAQYSTGVACLGFLCFALATASLALPLWGYFHNAEGKPSSNRP
jgi:hypothetical protein